MTENTAPTTEELRDRINAADGFALHYVLGWLSAGPATERAALAEALDAADARKVTGG